MPPGGGLVVEGACLEASVQGGERLRHQGVDEPVVVDEPGGDDLLLARGAGDGGNAQMRRSHRTW